MIQRTGPARTSSTGRRSGSHGRYGSVHSQSRQMSDAIAAARRPRSPRRAQTTTSAVAASADSTRATNHARDAKSATLEGPCAPHCTAWIEAGISQTATASARQPAVTTTAWRGDKWSDPSLSEDGHVVSRIHIQRRTLEPALERGQQAHETLRQKIREERKVADLGHRHVTVHPESVRQEPALHAFVDQVQRREHVAHIEPKQDAARVDLVNKQQTSWLQHAQKLGKRTTLRFDRFKMMKHIDDVQEI